MKTKRFFAVILAAVMICSSSAVFAESSDAVNQLKDYGIIQGDPNGDLRLDDGITRAEFVKVICKLNATEVSEGEATATPFSDVPSKHWASGYIYAAYGLGFANGYEDGIFKPDEDITYSEVVKMLVGLLGYTPFAENNGGYPQGYLRTANRYGFFNEVTFEADSICTRKDAFKMSATALDIPIMDQIVYGAEPEYAIMDGQGEYPLVTLQIRSGF